MGRATSYAVAGLGILAAAASATFLDRWCEGEWYLTWRTLRHLGLRTLEVAPVVLGGIGLLATALRRVRQATMAFLLAASALGALVAGSLAFAPVDEPPLAPAWWAFFVVPAGYAGMALALALDAGWAPRGSRVLFQAGAILSAGALGLSGLWMLIAPRVLDGHGRGHFWPRSGDAWLLWAAGSTVLHLLGLRAANALAPPAFGGTPFGRHR